MDGDGQAMASRLTRPSPGWEGGGGLETSMQLQVESGVRADKRSREHTNSSRLKPALKSANLYSRRVTCTQLPPLVRIKRRDRRPPPLSDDHDVPLSNVRESYNRIPEDHPTEP